MTPLAAHLAAACPGWRLVSERPYVMALPGGDEAEIWAEADFVAWLEHRERERGARPVQTMMELEAA